MGIKNRISNPMNNAPLREDISDKLYREERAYRADRLINGAF